MNGDRRYLLDTNALIALGNGNEGLLNMLESAEYVATSVICQLEYLAGIAGDEQACGIFLKLLDTVDVVDLRHVDVGLTNAVVEIRAANKHIKLPDAIVVASALMRKAKLVTNDKQLQGAGICDVVGF